MNGGIELKYNQIAGIVGIEQYEEFLDVIEDSKMQLIKDLAIQLSDEKIGLMGLNDRNKGALARLVIQYGRNMEPVINDTKVNVDRMANGARRYIYRMDAVNGIRIATNTEIEDGALGLIEEVKYTISEENFRLVKLMAWTVHGRHRDLIDGVGKYVDKNLPLYEKIIVSANDLIKLFNWVSQPVQYLEDRDKLLKMNKVIEEYKYPDYAYDEVKSEYSPRQLVYYLDKNLPRGSSDKDTRRALNLVINFKKTKYFRLGPMEKQLLRKEYEKAIKVVKKEEETGSQLKDDCEKLLKARKDGLVDKNHFAFKIIETLRGFGYSRCSEKQYDIIRDALLKVKEAKELNQTFFKEDQLGQLLDKGKGMDNEIITGDDLLDISNDLGAGVLWDDD